MMRTVPPTVELQLQLQSQLQLQLRERSERRKNLNFTLILQVNFPLLAFCSVAAAFSILLRF